MRMEQRTGRHHRTTGHKAPVRRQSADARSPRRPQGRSRVSYRGQQEGIGTGTILLGVAFGLLILGAAYAILGGSKSSPTTSRESGKSTPSASVGERQASKPKGPPSVNIQGDTFSINGELLNIPTSLSRVEEILGPPSRSEKKSNIIHTWDSLGIFCYESRDRVVVQISFALQPEDLSFGPRNMFRGVIQVTDAKIASGDTYGSITNKMRIPEFLYNPVTGWYRRNGPMFCVTLVGDDKDVVRHVSVGLPETQ